MEIINFYENIFSFTGEHLSQESENIFYFHPFNILSTIIFQWFTELLIVFHISILWIIESNSLILHSKIFPPLMKALIQYYKSRFFDCILLLIVDSILRYIP